VLNVFIHASLESRVERAIKVYQVDEEKAEDVCLKADKQRANFYNYYSDRKWGMCRTYDVSLDSSKIGIDGCADLIIAFANVWKEHKGQGI